MRICNTGTSKKTKTGLMTWDATNEIVVDLVRLNRINQTPFSKSSGPQKGKMWFGAKNAHFLGKISSTSCGLRIHLKSSLPALKDD